MKSSLEALRTLLILGRVSNLPTVWSNLIAGWLLARGPSDGGRLLALLFGGSFLYVGGMYLNDFCDAEFDAQFCKQRPIPAGKISRRAVGGLAGLWFVAGLACILWSGWLATGVALILIAAIVLYDFHHKNVSWAPWLMGFCRFLLYPLAAFACVNVSIWQYGTVWVYVCLTGATLGLYVAGITYLARGESRPNKPARWALLLLLLPGVVSFGIYLLNSGLYWPAPQLALPLFGPLLLGWMAWLLVPLWRKANRSIGRVVSGLLAGIVLVDVLLLTSVLVSWRAYGDAACFLPLFFLALLLQRVIPAT